MSIAAATRKAYAVDAEAKSPQFRKASTEAGVETGLEKITQWIPSEVVTSYVALLGLFAPDDATLRWTLFGVGVLLVLVFVVVNAALVNKKGTEKWKEDGKPGEPPKLARKRVFGLIAVGLVAYVVWACALPDTPFLDLTDQATRIGGGLVIVISLLMPKVTDLLDLKVSE